MSHVFSDETHRNLLSRIPHCTGREVADFLSDEEPVCPVIIHTTNSQAAGSTRDAVKDAELVVLAVPEDKVDEVVGALSSELDGKVVIDVTNRVDVQNPARVMDGTSVAERIQKRVPKAHVVKAFTYAFASRQADPKVNGTRLDGFVAGRVPACGFRPVDAGPLAMARALESMALLNIMLQIRNKWPWQNGRKLAGPPEESEAKKEATR